ncbi:uncharacterized protein LOC116187256 isoform X2 [Punica granatum]|uniref:Uncharacterized protein LOC116187256 isoform X2 n=1 Tax=Punica granatum TaxID=22663 RepID=A0A6P8BN85_PUNGR|nr:uncharacterized protein LOC116187256 isoform X2 [Punica granatum]
MLAITQEFELIPKTAQRCGCHIAIFESFKGINELIRDMLGLKGRYSAVESKLKEMHGWYSQLSLQFTEVERARQKLMMTVKCVRCSKKAPESEPIIISLCWRIHHSDNTYIDCIKELSLC